VCAMVSCCGVRSEVISDVQVQADRHHLPWFACLSMTTAPHGCWLCIQIGAALGCHHRRHGNAQPHHAEYSAILAWSSSIAILTEQQYWCSSASSLQVASKHAQQLIVTAHSIP
jgi:hypothetical protein